MKEDINNLEYWESTHLKGGYFLYYTEKKCTYELGSILIGKTINGESIKLLVMDIFGSILKVCLMKRS